MFAVAQERGGRLAFWLANELHSADGPFRPGDPPICGICIIWNICICTMCWAFTAHFALWTPLGGVFVIWYICICTLYWAHFARAFFVRRAHFALWFYNFVIFSLLGLFVFTSCIGPILPARFVLHRAHFALWTPQYVVFSLFGLFIFAPCVGPISPARFILQRAHFALFCLQAKGSC